MNNPVVKNNRKDIISIIRIEKVVIDINMNRSMDLMNHHNSLNKYKSIKIPIQINLNMKMDK